MSSPRLDPELAEEIAGWESLYTGAGHRPPYLLKRIRRSVARMALHGVDWNPRLRLMLDKLARQVAARDAQAAAAARDLRSWAAANPAAGARLIAELANSGTEKPGR